MNTETLRQIFKSPFDYATYSHEIVHRLFGCNDVASRPEWLDTNAEGDQSFFIGQMDDADHRLLGFFYTRVADGGDVRRKRVGLRKLISPYLKYDVDGAIAVFDDGRHWRLSYICDLKEGSTSAKRFSYILGDENGQYKTPLERLEKIAKLSGRLKLSDLRESFSVDALSDEFFDEYHLHYDRIVTELAQSYRRDVPWRVSTDGTSDARLHDYVKKMMGRIVFLHFLQKKGWLNGDPNFMQNTFRNCNHQDDYLESVLEPLFFGMLNTEPEHREEVFRNHHWNIDLLHQWQPAQNNSSSNSIPYLNGGLFEEDDIDKLRVTLPARTFKMLFDFLASYNFTVDENDPDDAEIGVDPEMLGKIFESLLEDNKAKGAFYTPKEIVRYMCKESLIAYLTQQLADCRDVPWRVSTDSAIRTFVETHEFPNELEPYRALLDRALREVKICDPAIGSGAFPMGLLNELWRCRESIRNDDRVGKNSRLQLKKEIIENNIYGVDIERGAIDIARLRFWLSIVVDSDEPAPLPNFDYKFMQGNSLIESFGGVDLSRLMAGGGMLSRIGKGRGKAGANQLAMEYTSDETRRNLQLMLKEYFSLTDHGKKAAARREINDSVKRYIRQQGLRPSAELRLAALDPSANQEFFLWHTWFKDIFDKGGFDIVVGNPPYVDYRRIDATTKSGLNIFSSYKIEKKGSLYVYFIEHGVNILRDSGVLYYINPYQYLSAESGNGIRHFIVKNHKLSSIVDVSNIKVFKDASTYTCINSIVKSNSQSDIVLFSPRDLVRIETNKSIIPKSSFIQKQNYVITLSHNSLIDDKLEQQQKILADICSIFCGLSKTGFRDYVTYCQESSEYQIFVESKQIKRYVTESEKYIDTTLYSTNALRCFQNQCLFMTRMTSHCRVAISNEGECAGKVNVLHSFKNYHIKFVLGLLNSRLIDYYYCTKNETKHLNGGALPFDTESIKSIPIPKLTMEQQQPIIALVDQILDAKKSNPSDDTSMLEREIDRLVYGLYGVTEEEIAVIERI